MDAVNSISFDKPTVADLLSMRIPARDIAKSIGGDISTRQIRKARRAHQLSIPSKALAGILASDHEMTGERARELHSKWTMHDMRHAAEHRVYAMLNDYRRKFERDRAAILKTTSQKDLLEADLREQVVNPTLSEAESKKLLIDVAAARQLATETKAEVDAAYKAYLDAHAEAKAIGVNIDHDRMVNEFRKMMQVQAEQKPTKPKTRKGSGDVHGHHRVSSRQLMDAAGR